MYQAVNPCIVAAIEGPIIIGNSFLLKPMIASIICIVIAVDKIILTTVLSILVMNGTIATQQSNQKGQLAQHTSE